MPRRVAAAVGTGTANGAEAAVLHGRCQFFQARRASVDDSIPVPIGTHAARYAAVGHRRGVKQERGTTVIRYNKQ